MNLVTCKRCGWVHFNMTKKQAQDAIDSFNDAYSQWSAEDQAMFGGPAKMSDYTNCFSCGFNEFRLFKDGDCPHGVTIQPVIAQFPEDI